MPFISDLLHRTYLSNALWQWLIAGAVALASMAIAIAVRRFARRKYESYAGTTRTELFEFPAFVLSRTSRLLILTIGACASLLALDMAGKSAGVLHSAVTIAAFWQIGIWVSAGVIAWLERKRRSTVIEDRAAAGSLAIVAFAARVLTWAVVLLLTLDNLGVDITALVAGLGVGGIAVALAVQNVLGDVLASLSITLDRPFIVGDFLILGEYMGSVEYIGIKSTRLRSLSGEQIVMSNADILASRVRNYGRMAERRVVFGLRVTYETPRAKLEKIAGILRSVIEEQEQTRFDRSHFAKYGTFSLEFEAVFYVLSPDYTRYMDIQQTILFRIHEELEKLGVEFAYPTQKLWMAGAQPGGEDAAGVFRVQTYDGRPPAMTGERGA